MKPATLTQRQQDQYKEVAFGSNPELKDLAKERLKDAAGPKEWNRVSRLYRLNYDQIEWEK